MTQELQIAAANHGGCAFDEADDHVAQWRGLPWIGGDPRVPVECCGDFAVARAAVMAIGRLHHETQTAPPLPGHACVRRHWPALPGTPETNKGFDPPERFSVQRNQGRKKPARFTAGKKDKLRVDRAVVDGVTSFRTVAMRAESSERRGHHG